MRPLILAFLLILVAIPASADRKALVIGNDDYEQLTDLKKAVNDANAVARVLRDQADFDVTLETNVTRDQMVGLMGEFLYSIEPGDTVLFYFSGHGVTADDRNYLLPVDAPSISTPFVVAQKGIEIDGLLQRMRRSEANLSLAILDACRNNPFPDVLRSGLPKRGMMNLSAPPGMFVLYAAGEGEAALDRLDDADPNPNSVFTRHLLPLMQQPGLDIRTLATRVQEKVYYEAQSVSHEQFPAYNPRFLGSFSFIPGVTDTLHEDFVAARNIDTLAAWRRFLNRHGTRQSDDRVRQAETRLAAYSVQTRCDEMVAHPYDPQNPPDVPGVEWDDVDGVAAVLACESAVEISPENARIRFQYARALHKQERFGEARTNYVKAVDLGSTAAMTNLAVMYADGEGVEKNPEKAIEWFLKAAELGNPQAQFSLGWRYDNGVDLRKDLPSAAWWYRKAAEQGHTQAQNNLGWALVNGKGVEKAPAEAVIWYSKAAQKGHAQAQTNLGWMYETGTGVTKDLATAAQWYLKAATNGNATAQLNLGLMYDNGNGVPEDTDKAVEWYEKAAQQGLARAQTNLAWIYDVGVGGYGDPKKAAEWYRKAAEQGSARAQNNLGVLYKSGTGVPKDAAKAAEWYRKAAEQGHARAQNNLGWLYESGTGVPEDLTTAVMWYRKSAEQGYANAQNNLGGMYEFGLGVEENLNEALEWYRKSADQGSAWGKLNLADVFASDDVSHRDIFQAANLYEQARLETDGKAEYRLARLYLRYPELGANTDEIAQLVLRADQQGQDATQNLLKGSGSVERETRKAIQRELRRAGYYNGAIDGVFGSGTNAALNRYVANESLPD